MRRNYENEIKSDDQIIRLFGIVLIVIGIHYIYEMNNIGRMKGASVGRTVFGLLTILLTYLNYFDKIFYIFGLHDGLPGIYGIIQSIRLQRLIKQLI